MAPLPTASKLSIYLNDHLAAATGAVELGRRIAGSNRGTRYGAALEELVAEIADDRDALLDVMGRLSAGRDRLKLALSWGAEKAGRLKLNGEIVRYSPLSRLEELEILTLGVNGKLGLWQALLAALGDDPRMSGVDLNALIERARAQSRRLERLRRRAAVEALADH